MIRIICWPQQGPVLWSHMLNIAIVPYTAYLNMTMLTVLAHVYIYIYVYTHTHMWIEVAAGTHALHMCVYMRRYVSMHVHIHTHIVCLICDSVPQPGLLNKARLLEVSRLCGWRAACCIESHCCQCPSMAFCEGFSGACGTLVGLVFWGRKSRLSRKSRPVRGL